MQDAAWNTAGRKGDKRYSGVRWNLTINAFKMLLEIMQVNQGQLRELQNPDRSEDYRRFNYATMFYGSCLGRAGLELEVCIIWEIKTLT